MRFYWVPGTQFLCYTCKENRQNFRLLQSFLSWGQVEWDNYERLASLGDKGDPPREAAKIFGPFNGLEGLTTIDLYTQFGHVTHGFLLLGCKIIVDTPSALSVMTGVALLLTNGAKSDFSDVIGQDMKEKEELKSMWVCLGVIVLHERHGLEQVTAREECEGQYVSPRGPWKDWDGPHVLPPIHIGPCVCVGVMNHRFFFFVLDVSNFHWVLRIFFLIPLCKTDNVYILTLFWSFVWSFC